NAIRKRNRMTPALCIAPRLVVAAFGVTLAASLESAVRREARFLSRFKANASRLFRKFERSAFEQVPQPCGLARAAVKRGAGLPPKRRLRARGTPWSGNRPFTMRREWHLRKPARTAPVARP